MIAENDQALGRIIEAITKSVYWKDSAVFVLEDLTAARAIAEEYFDSDKVLTRLLEKLG